MVAKLDRSVDNLGPHYILIIGSEGAVLWDFRVKKLQYRKYRIRQGIEIMYETYEVCTKSG